jgi:hypothetical protein
MQVNVPTLGESPGTTVAVFQAELGKRAERQQWSPMELDKRAEPNFRGEPITGDPEYPDTVKVRGNRVLPL